MTKLVPCLFLVLVGCGPEPARAQVLDSAPGVRPEVTELARASQLLVLEAAAALGLSSRTPDTWLVEIDPALASPFVSEHSCQPVTDRSTSVCSTSGHRTVCSQNAIEALAAIQNGNRPIVCGGAHREGDRADLARVEGSISALAFVLAHELGHVERGDRGTVVSPPWTMSGGREARLERLRQAVRGSPELLAREEEADRFASRIYEWLVERVARRQPEHAAYIATTLTVRLRLAILCLDFATRCAWDDRIRLPPEESYVRGHARALVCEALRVPDGTTMPAVRGTHADWASRMAFVQPLALRFGAVDVPGNPALTAEMRRSEEGFRFWAEHAESYYRQLASAVGRESLQLDAGSCSEDDGNGPTDRQ